MKARWRSSAVSNVSSFHGWNVVSFSRIAAMFVSMYRDGSNSSLPGLYVISFPSTFMVSTFGVVYMGMLGSIIPEFLMLNLQSAWFPAL